ncbi:MAG: metallophosphoesterase family protein [Aggregatilineales bacterium]
MRLALFSDIHGNPIALEAVLREINDNVDGYIVIGDHLALGYDPVTTLQMLQSLPNAVFTRGNTDRYVITGDRPYPSVDDALNDPALMPRLMEVQANFEWTRGYLSSTDDGLDWLAALPLEYRLTLPDGTRLLAVHASPGHDDGTAFAVEQTDEEMFALVEGCQADIVAGGHWHNPLQRCVNGIHCLNVASVSNPHGKDWRASYVILEADTTGYSVTFHRGEYDYEAVRQAFRKSGNRFLDYQLHFWDENRQM